MCFISPKLTLHNIYQLAGHYSNIVVLARLLLLPHVLTDIWSLTGKHDTIPYDTVTYNTLV